MTGTPTVMASPRVASPWPASAGDHDVCATVSVALTPRRRAAAADARLAEAVEQYEAGRPFRALSTIDLAECHEDRPAYDYMRAVISTQVGRCREAWLHMRHFEASDPDPVDWRALHRELEPCAPHEPVDRVPLTLTDFRARRAPQSAGPFVDDRRSMGRSSSQPRPHLDLATGALLASGTVAVAVGALVVLAGRGSGSANRSGASDDAVAAQRRRRVGGGTLVGAGTALLVSAFVRYVVLADRLERRSAGRRGRRSFRTSRTNLHRPARH